MKHRIARKILSVNMRAGMTALGLLAVLALLVISLSVPSAGYAQTTGPTPTPVPSTNTPAPAATNTPVPAVTNTPAPGATDTPAPGATDTPAPGNTVTPTPSNTVAPGATNTPSPVPPGPSATNTPLPGPQGQPNLTISKVVNPAQAPVGTQVIFTVVVTNNGTADATDVTVTDPVPSQFQVLSASSTKGAVQLNGQLVTVTIGTMAPGEVVTITIVTRALTPTLGPVTNKATAVYTNPNNGNPNSSTVDASVDASIIKSELPHSGKSDLGVAGWLALAAACGSLAWLVRRRAATGK
ncbi:MAG: hypothetical protein M3Z04_02735 [Chloroflexota bacterium]|nr:hypothetical protein [Chloroflexota bacterium]